MLFEHHRHGTRCAGFAHLAPQFEQVSAIRPDKMQVGGRVGPLNSIECVRHGGGQRLRSVPGGTPLDDARKCELDRCQTRRHDNLVRGLTIFKEGKIIDELRRRDAVEVGRDNRQPHLFEAFDWDLGAVEKQPRPHDNRGFRPSQQSFAVDVEACLEGVVFGFVPQEVETREVSAGQDHRHPSGRGAEGNHDRPVVGAGIHSASQPEAGVGDRLSGLIEDGEGLTIGDGAHHVLQPSLPDEGPAALTIADEIDDIHPGTIELGELKPAGDPAGRRVVVLERLLGTGDEAVEIDVGVDLPAMLSVVARGVDFEDTNDQRGDIFDRQLERDRLPDRELHRVGRQKGEVDAVLELLILRGREQTGPLFRSSQTAGDLGLGKHLPEIDIVDEWLEFPCVRSLPEERQQELAYQAFIVADGGESGEAVVIVVQPAGKLPDRLAFEKFAGGIRDRAGKLEIGEEPGLVGLTLAQVELQLVIRDMGLERVVGLVEPPGQLRKPVQMCLQQLGHRAPVLFGRGS